MSDNTSKEWHCIMFIRSLNLLLNIILQIKLKMAYLIHFSITRDETDNLK